MDDKGTITEIRGVGIRCRFQASVVSTDVSVRWARPYNENVHEWVEQVFWLYQESTCEGVEFINPRISICRPGPTNQWFFPIPNRDTESKDLLLDWVNKYVTSSLFRIVESHPIQLSTTWMRTAWTDEDDLLLPITDYENRKKVMSPLNPEIERQARLQRMQNSSLVLKGSQPYGTPWVELSTDMVITLTGPRLGQSSKIIDVEELVEPVPKTSTEAPKEPKINLNEPQFYPLGEIVESMAHLENPLPSVPTIPKYRQIRDTMSIEPLGESQSVRFDLLDVQLDI